MADERQNRKRRAPIKHEQGFSGVPGKHEGGGKYPAYREDPFQRIVDVNWTAAAVILAQQGLLGTNLAPSFLSATGTDWTDSGFEADPVAHDITATGASGEGFTVIARGGWLVYGEPKDGDPCFIAVTPCGGVYRGVEDEDTIVWTYVCGLNNLPLAEFYGYGFEYNSTICGVSFAGEMFFIGLAAGNTDDPTFLACSSDGENWQFVKIFADTQGAAESDNYASRYSGNVAYSPEFGLYCITGTIDATFAVGDNLRRNILFMWDTSTDGLNWSGGSFDHSPEAPITGMGGPPSGFGNIAYGNGLFVAIGSKHATADVIDSVYQGTAAVAVSSDGNVWDYIDLPEAALSNCSEYIAYVNADAGGFFFATGVVAGGSLEVSNYLWTSPTGTEWTLQSAADRTSVNYEGASVVSDPVGTVLAFPACAGDNHAGAIFVSGDRAAQIRYAKMEARDSPQEWIAVGDITDTSGFGQILSGAYAKIDGRPTFVFGGNCTRGGDTTTNIAVIVYSHDGLTWTDALLRPLASVNSMVWDVNDKHFYADVHDFDIGELPYRSPDGINWTPVTDGTFTADHYRYTSAYANAYDITTDTTIDLAINGLAHVAKNACFGPNEVYDVATGLDPVRATNAVAYAGGIWIMGGFADASLAAGTSTSIDNGQTWTVVSTGKLGMDWDAQIEFVLGAPIEDFS